jgi:Flp pilus assembly protein TadG
MRHRPHTHRSERGQALVEFALVAQVFLLLCFLIYQGGVAWYDKLALEQGTRDAARKAAVNRALGQAGMDSAARAALVSTASGLDSSYLSSPLHTQVTCAPDPYAPDDGITCGQGDLLTVHSQYPYSIGIFGLGLSGNLTASTTERIE